MKFDIVFVDSTTPHPYDEQSPNVMGMGGTEKTVVAVAEGLAHLGLSIAVFERPLLTATKGRAFYLPFSAMQDHATKVCVALRGTVGFNEFKGAKKVSWLHDMPDARLLELKSSLLVHNSHLVAVSSYHRNQILDLFNREEKTDNIRITTIYNPVIPVGFGMTKDTKYDKNRLVWASSPHKGLPNAIELFELAKKHIPTLTMTVFNPGYMTSGYKPTHPDIEVVGSRPSHEVWETMRNSLCVFYPSTFKETFGLVFAEANAVGCPVLAYEVGALPEVIKPRSQFVKQDVKEVINRLKMWHNGDAPRVKGNKAFALKNVLNDWVNLIKRL